MIRLALVLALSACVAPSGPQQVNDAVTGSYGAVSREYRAAAGVTVRAGYEVTAGYALFVDYRASQWAFIDSAYTNGQRLGYTVTDRVLIGCDGGCKIRESGIIRLTADQMQRYASTGLRFSLIGQGRQIDAAVPPSVFSGAMK